MVRIPLVHILSFTAMGTPARGPWNLPALMPSSTSSACASLSRASLRSSSLSRSASSLRSLSSSRRSLSSSIRSLSSSSRSLSSSICSSLSLTVSSGGIIPFCGAASCGLLGLPIGGLIIPPNGFATGIQISCPTCRLYTSTYGFARRISARGTR